MSAPLLSIIIRARDEAPALERCLTLLGPQIRAAGAELILVDGGSRDGGAQLAREQGARVVSVSPGSFSFGGSLNLGAANARATVLVALSAHAYPPDGQWLERLAAAFDSERVACASGDPFDPEGARLASRVDQDIELARSRPEWGYSNGAGAFRADLWRQRPFREDLPGCEDKEWAMYWLQRGYVCAIDPGLTVAHDHTHDSLTSIYSRAKREWSGLAAFTALDPYGPRELARDWWSDLRWYRSAARARISHRRAARLLGAYAGRRQAFRDRAGR